MVRYLDGGVVAQMVARKGLRVLLEGTDGARSNDRSESFHVQTWCNGDDDFRYSQLRGTAGMRKRKRRRIVVRVGAICRRVSQSSESNSTALVTPTLQEVHVRHKRL